MSAEDRAAIARALDHAPSRERRRRESIAAGYQPELEEMERQLRDDPARFDATYGPHGRVLVGMNQAARAAREES